jgi:hypothetical protein
VETQVPADETFDLALGLHACGAATDDAQRAALARGVGYVLVPCCVGKLKEAGDAAGPRSRWLRDALGAGGSMEFLTLAAAADHKPPPPPPPDAPEDGVDAAVAPRAPRTFRITTAKDLVEADRSAAAVSAICPLGTRPLEVETSGVSVLRWRALRLILA